MNQGQTGIPQNYELARTQWTLPAGLGHEGSRQDRNYAASPGRKVPGMHPGRNRASR